MTTATEPRYTIRHIGNYLFVVINRHNLKVLTHPAYERDAQAIADRLNAGTMKKEALS